MQLERGVTPGGSRGSREGADTPFPQGCTGQGVALDIVLGSGTAHPAVWEGVPGKGQVWSRGPAAALGAEAGMTQVICVQQHPAWGPLALEGRSGRAKGARLLPTPVRGPFLLAWASEKTQCAEPQACSPPRETGWPGGP